MLEIVQAQFAAALLQKEDKLDFISSENARVRFDVYRNTVKENLVNALALIYPGVWRLLGEDCAKNVARLFCSSKANLPTSGCLDNWGAGFAHFLSTLPQLESLSYLQDFATYEWYKQLSLTAPQSSVVPIQELKAYTQKQLINLKLTFKPCLFLFHSIYPLDAIEQLVNKGQNEGSLVNLTQGPSWALITCIDDQSHTFWLAPMNWYFIKQLQVGKKLLNALNKTLVKYPTFELTKALHFILEAQLIAKI